MSEYKDLDSHIPIPELIEMFHRYQCKICKVWVNYSEAKGKWLHVSNPDRSQS